MVTSLHRGWSAARRTRIPVRFKFKCWIHGGPHHGSNLAFWHQTILSRCFLVLWISKWGPHGSDLIQSNPWILKWIEIWGICRPGRNLCHVPVVPVLCQGKLCCWAGNYPWGVSLTARITNPKSDPITELVMLMWDPEKKLVSGPWDGIVLMLSEVKNKV